MSQGTPATPKRPRSASPSQFRLSPLFSGSLGTPRKRGRVDVQQLVFLYNKKEKDAAILKFRETMNEVPDQSGGTQPILRAARAIVGIVIGVSQENGAYAKLVMDSAKDMLFGPDPQKLETALGENFKAAVGMIRADHSPGGWTALRFLAAFAAQANRDPNSLKSSKGTQTISLKGCPPPPFYALRCVHFGALCHFQQLFLPSQALELSWG